MGGIKSMKLTFHKIVLLFFITVVCTLNARADIKFQLNKINSFYIFSEAILGVKNRPITHKIQYEKRYKSNTSLENKRAELKSLYKKIRKTRIYDYKGTVSLLSALHIESTFVKSLDALERKIMDNYKTSIRKKELKRYFELLKPFVPIFDELIWNPNYKKMLQVKANLNGLVKEIDLNKIITNIAHFYRLKPKELRDLYVNLYPIINGKSFNALRIQNTAPVGIIINNKKSNLKWMLSAVVLHEFCHEIYGLNKKNILKMITEQSPQLAKDKAFKRVFDESMQTSISAGFIYQKLSGKLFKGPWYNNTTYDLYAKLLYGEIIKYLKTNREIDKEFILKAIQFYQQI